MLKAATAKKTTKAYIDELQRKHDIEYARIKAAEKKHADEVWNARSKTLIDKIEGYIKRDSAKGQNYIYEPNKINPYGDSVVYLEEADQCIKDRLMDYFRCNGFKVTDYGYGGMKIEW